MAYIIVCTSNLDLVNTIVDPEGQSNEHCCVRYLKLTISYIHVHAYPISCKFCFKMDTMHHLHELVHDYALHHTLIHILKVFPSLVLIFKNNFLRKRREQLR